MAPALGQWLQDIRAWAQGTEEVAAVWVYGSRARGEERPDSDLDIAYELVGKTPQQRLGIWMAVVDRWVRPTLTPMNGFESAPHVHLKWFEPEGLDGVETEVVAAAVRRDGRLIWRRPDKR